MNIIYIVVILFILTNLIKTETTREPLNDVQLRTTAEILSKDFSSSKPNSHETVQHRSYFQNPASRQSHLEDDYGSHHVMLKNPYSITKLAKTLSFGLDPYFSKVYFEPFERRPKPVTLVAFRKNGLVPRKTIKVDTVKSSEAAELQSPYNEVSSFWQNEPSGS